MPTSPLTFTSDLRGTLWHDQVKKGLHALTSGFRDDDAETGDGYPTTTYAAQVVENVVSGWVEKRNAANTAWFKMFRIDAIIESISSEVIENADSPFQIPNSGTSVFRVDTDNGDVVIILPDSSVATQRGIVIDYIFGGITPGSVEVQPHANDTSSLDYYTGSAFLRRPGDTLHVWNLAGAAGFQVKHDYSHQTVEESGSTYTMKVHELMVVADTASNGVDVTLPNIDGNAVLGNKLGTREFVVCKKDAASGNALRVFPASGEQINSLGVDVSETISSFARYAPHGVGTASRWFRVG